MKIYKFGEWKELNENTVVFVGRSGSGQTLFGEPAKLNKVTDKHLEFVTDSGAVVKTNHDMNTIGKAKKANYWVGFGDRTNCEHTIIEKVSYWNDKKLCLENK